MNIASAWWITNLATMTKCDLYVMGERSDPLAASAASQAGRSVLRGAIAQRSALQLLVFYEWARQSRIELAATLHLQAANLYESGSSFQCKHNVKIRIICVSSCIRK